MEEWYVQLRLIQFCISASVFVVHRRWQLERYLYVQDSVRSFFQIKYFSIWRLHSIWKEKKAITFYRITTPMCNITVKKAVYCNNLIPCWHFSLQMGYLTLQPCLTMPSHLVSDRSRKLNCSLSILLCGINIYKTGCFFFFFTNGK